MRGLVAVALCAVTGVALAEEATTLTVAVGQTVERDVGYAIGLRCDDVSIIRPEMKAKTPATNTFVVTGVKEGTTLCRVGTDPHRPTVLYEIHVIARPLPGHR